MKVFTSADDIKKVEELDKKMVEKMDKDGTYCFDIN